MAGSVCDVPVTTASTSAAQRCAAHPSRPAVDSCPVCARPRCGADATAPDCRLCATSPTATDARPRRPKRQVTDLERLVRAGIVGMLVCLAGGPVASQYVQSGLFAYVGPFVIGVVCGAATLRAAGTDGRGPVGLRVRGTATFFALLSVALGFSLEGSQGVLSTASALPYLAAGSGALLWTVPPKAAKRPPTGQGAGTDA